VSAAAAWCLLSAVARAVQQALLGLGSTSGAIVNGCHTTLLLPRERDSGPAGAGAAGEPLWLARDSHRPVGTTADYCRRCFAIAPSSVRGRVLAVETNRTGTATVTAGRCDCGRAVDDARCLQSGVERHPQLAPSRSRKRHTGEALLRLNGSRMHKSGPAARPDLERSVLGGSANPSEDRIGGAGWISRCRVGYAPSDENGSRDRCPTAPATARLGSRKGGISPRRGKLRGRYCGLTRVQSSLNEMLS